MSYESISLYYALTNICCFHADGHMNIVVALQEPDCMYCTEVGCWGHAHIYSLLFVNRGGQQKI